MLQGTGDRSQMNNEYTQTKFMRLDQDSSSNNRSYAPFLMTSKRFAFNKNKQFSPPIGAYDLPSCFESKKSSIENQMSHFILESRKKNEQMSIFKSSFNRFQKKQISSPGPAAYNLYQTPSTSKKEELRDKYNKENCSQIPKGPPSIPYKDNKFGYSITDGDIKRIDKSQEQLQKQRESRKNYLERLDGQHYARSSRSSLNLSYHNNEKKKMAQQTSKFFDKSKDMLNTTSKSQITIIKRPKFEHLYNSKPILDSKNYKFLGPGQYNITKELHDSRKSEKYQFFGSTEVRFRQKQQFQEKGYTLLQMIKASRQKQSDKITRKLPYRNSLSKSSSQKILCNRLVAPGPGQYNPLYHTLKQNKRKAFFPVSQRFKQDRKEQESKDEDEENQFSKSRSKLKYNCASLKKQRFKPMHQYYEPVKSEQICGILSQNSQPLHKDKRQQTGKVIRITTKRGTEADIHEINSWSRQQTRKKGNIKNLKEQLAFISYTPTPQVNPIPLKQATKLIDRTKKNHKKNIQDESEDSHCE